jgi:hypothetical protein
MHWSNDSAFEEVRRVQRELHEEARRVQLLARVRREQLGPRESSRGPLTTAVRMVRGALTRP